VLCQIPIKKGTITSANAQQRTYSVYFRPTFFLMLKPKKLSNQKTFLIIQLNIKIALEVHLDSKNKY